jgi:hypothetical protein
MSEWKTTHYGEDDPLGPAMHVEEAYGVKFDPPVPISSAMTVVQSSGKAMRLYVSEVVAAWTKLRKTLDASASTDGLKLLAKNLSEQILREHAKETGQTLTFVTETSNKPPKTESSFEKEVEECKGIIQSLGLNKDDAIEESDTTRMHIVNFCERYIATGGSSKKKSFNPKTLKIEDRLYVRCTVGEIVRAVNGEFEEYDVVIRNKLLSTLLHDNWIFFVHEGDCCVLPYGRGIPCYNADIEEKDHPFWERDL